MDAKKRGPALEEADSFGNGFGLGLNNLLDKSQDVVSNHSVSCYVSRRNWY